ncbi:GntR family transcriptional regulator [Arthrobacter sp. NPDC057009]|uniref:GntR family transcriptional regulator n=1 Tax=Arthrobacter sp. NPDC057009 TaxID=3345996 RepID=UPI00362D1FA6
MIALDATDPTPPYEQVREQIASLIRSGGLPGGHRLPTIRQLAADLRIAPGTIARAYRSLETSGLVETSRAGGTKVRSGNAVSERVHRETAAFLDSLADEPVALEDLLATLTALWPKRGQLLQAEPKAT